MSRIALAKKRALSQGSLSGASAAAGAAPGTGGEAGAGKPKSKFHPLKILGELDTGSVLTGKDLRKAARALTALEVRPQVHGYSLLAKQLHGERETEAQGLGTLGTHLQGGVTDVYKNIAASEADSLARQQALAGQLNTTSANIATEGQQGLAGMQEGQLGDYTQALQQRGAPGGGSAQQELANAVALQDRSQAANSEAARQSAASQGASSGALSAALAGATQMQGGGAVAGIGRDIIGRVAASNQKYDEGIQTARSKLADVKATKGGLFTKNLLGLREGEQKFLLGSQAVQGDKAKLAAEAKQDAASNAIAQQNADSSRISANASALNAATSAWEARHPNASSGERAEHRKEVKHDVGEIKSLLAPVIAELGAPPKNEKQLNILIGKINSKASADPTLVAKVLQHWWTERTQGNRGNKGATKVPYAP